MNEYEHIDSLYQEYERDVEIQNEMIELDETFQPEYRDMSFTSQKGSKNDDK